VGRDGGQRQSTCDTKVKSGGLGCGPVILNLAEYPPPYDPSCTVLAHIVLSFC